MPRRLPLVLALLACGCLPELGECDPVAARRLVFDEGGLPAYEGQAVMIASCASGGVCHAEPLPGQLQLRFGVPDALTYDVQLASFDARVDERAIVRQRRGRFRVVQEARNILGVVHAGTMPPPSGGPDSPSELFFEQAPRYATAEGDALAPAATQAGQDILQNWLACGAPVVERTVPRPDGVESVVAGRLPNLDPIEPTWASIHGDLLLARCAGSLCHGGNEDAGLQVLNDPAAAYGALTSGDYAMASGVECGGPGRQALIVPGSPSESLLYLKIAGRTSCGDAMPPNGAVGEEDLAAIAAWITDGASP